MTSRSKMQQWFNQRFPQGRDVWKFAKSRRAKSLYAVDMETLGPVPEWPSIDVPDEIVEHIYRMGWNDSKEEAVQRLNESKDYK